MSEQTGNGGAGAVQEAIVRVTGSAPTDLPRPREVRVTGSGLGDLLPARVQVSAPQPAGATGLAHSGRELTVRDVYPALADAGPSILADAVRLLEEGLSDLDQALQHEEAGDAIGADDALMRFRALLPELFACRSLGDGYAMIMGALIVAFQQHGPESMTRAEIRAVKAAVFQAHREPYMVEEVGANSVDALEDAGLQVRLSGLDHMLDDDDAGAERVP